MDNSTRISIDPEIMHGKPCIRTTRIPVDLILELLEAGEPFSEILEMYPSITKNDIQACIAYARKKIEEATVIEPKGTST